MSIKKPDKINTSNYTKEQNELLDWAIETICEKYLKAGGNKDDLMTWEQLDAFFCGLLHREGEQAIKDFVNNHQYKVPEKRVIGYAGI